MREHLARRVRALVPGEAGGEDERQQDVNGPAASSSAATSGDQASRAAARAPSSGSSAPPAPPATRAVSVAKYQPPASTSRRRAVGDRRARRPAARRGRRPRRRTPGRGWRRCTAAPSAARRASRSASVRLGGAVHAARRLVEARQPRRLLGVQDDRQRQPLALAAGEVARMAVGEPVEADGGERAERGLVADALVQRGSRWGPGAAARRGRPRAPCRASAPCRPAAWRSSVDLPAPLRPISATRSPGRDRQVDAAQDRRPPRRSCQTPSKRSAARRAARRARAARATPASPRSAPTRARRSASRSSPRARSAARASLTPAGGGRRPAPRGTCAPPASAARARASAAQARNAARRRVAGDRAVGQRDDAVGGRQAALEPVLGEQDRRPPLLVEPPQQPDQLVAGDGVELRGRLVEQHQPRAARQRRAERDALQLAAADSSVRRPVQQVRDPERERRLLHPARDRRRRRGRGSPAGTPARRARSLITTCVSGSWNSEPATARQLAPARARACPCRRRAPRPPNVPPWKCGTSPAARAQQRRLAATPSGPARTTNSPSLDAQRDVAQRRRPSRPGRCSVTRSSSRTAASVTARSPAGRRTAAARRSRAPRRRAAPRPAPAPASRRIGVEAPRRRPARAPTVERDQRRRRRPRTRGRGATTGAPARAAAPRAAVAAHLQRRGDVERAIERARRDRPHDRDRARAPLAAAVGPAAPRLRRCAARRAASTGTSRVASVAASAERTDARRNDAQQLVGIDARR